jgi:hypothetical protein
LSQVQRPSVPWKLEGLEYRDAMFWRAPAVFKGLKEVAVFKVLDKVREKHNGGCTIHIPGGSCFPSNDMLKLPRGVTDIEHHYLGNNKKIIEELVQSL